MRCCAVYITCIYVKTYDICLHYLYLRQDLRHLFTLPVSTSRPMAVVYITCIYVKTYGICLHYLYLRQDLWHLFTLPVSTSRPTAFVYITCIYVKTYGICFPAFQSISINKYNKSIQTQQIHINVFSYLNIVFLLHYMFKIQDSFFIVASYILIPLDFFFHLPTDALCIGCINN